jgi:hypothetical protein
LSYNTYIHGNITRKLPAKLFLNKQKCLFFFFFFFFTKPEKQEGRRVPGGECTSGRGEDVGKGAGG